MQLGKYRLLGLLGRGGMGEVWTAHDPDLDRKVAVKVLRHTSSGAEGQARLLREGRAMARLRHPNVVTVYEAASGDGRDFVAMELVDGDSMASWLQGTHTAARRVAVLLAAGRGLAAAHAAGMIHRDFKPHNVLIDHNGRTLVTDFGLARALDTASAESSAMPARAELDAVARTLAATPAAPERFDETAAAAPMGGTRADTGQRSATGDLDSPLTRTGALLGTPAYMAPEQLEGRVADARADQFAFCVTAWETLAGRRPFDGQTLDEIQTSMERGTPANEDRVPRRLRAILKRGLAIDPAARWAAMDVLLRALDRAWRRPRRVAIGVAVAVAIAGATLGASALRRQDVEHVTQQVACADPEKILAPLSSPEIQELMGRLRATKPIGERIATFSDRWVVDWRATHATTCKSPEAPTFHARTACLESLVTRNLALLASLRQLPLDKLVYGDAAMQMVSPTLCLEHPIVAAPVVRTREGVEIWADSFKLSMATPVPAGRSAFVAGADVLVARARQQHDPVLLSLVLVAVGDGLTQGELLDERGCKLYEEAVSVAETASNDLSRLDALFGLVQCALVLPDRGDQATGLLERAASLVDRLGDPGRRGLLQRLRSAQAAHAGDLERALTLVQSARAIWSELDAIRTAAAAAYWEIRIRRQRNKPDDLRIAAELAYASIPVLVTYDRLRAALLRELVDIEWSRGEVAASDVAADEAYAQPVPATARMTIHVLDAAGHDARGAEWFAAARPIGDAVRFMRTQFGYAAHGVVDAGGRATIESPAGALVFVRKGTELAVAPATAELELRLQPAMIASGRVTSNVPSEATISLTTMIGDQPWIALAPVVDGRWQLPTLPGRMVLEVQVTSPLQDARTARRTIELAAGTRIEDLILPPTIASRVILHPAMQVPIVVVAGAHSAKTWPAVIAMLAAAPAMTYTDAQPAVPRALSDVPVGDSDTPLGIPQSGPITICVLPGASSPPGVPMYLITPGPATTPPRCFTTMPAPIIKLAL